MYPDRSWALLLVLLFMVSCAQIPKEIYDPTATSDKSESSEDLEQAAIVPSEVEPPPPDQSTEDTQEKEYSVFRGSQRVQAAIQLGYTHIEGIIING